MKIIRKILFFAVPVLLITAAMIQLSDTAASKAAFAAADDKYKAFDSFTSVMDLVDSQYVEPVDSKEAIYGAIKGMLQELDPHSTFFTPDEFKSFQEGTSGSFGGLGITISLKNDAITVISAIEDTPAWKAGIRGGDVIAMIDNESAAGMSLEAAVKKMRGKPGTKVKLTLARKGADKPIELTLTRAVIKIKSVKSAMIDKNLGYIRLSQFQENSFKEMADAVKTLKKEGAKGFILDLRNNGGGLLNEAILVSSIFLPSQKTVVFTRDRNKREQHYMTESVNVKDTESPLVVITNEWSASASEIVAGALQDYKRAIIAGKTTFGKGSVQSVIPMGDGSAVKLTTSRYYTPADRSIQGVGITPDIEIEPGKVDYSSDYYVVREKDLSGHLKGENETADTVSSKGKDNKNSIEAIAEAEARILPSKEDLQYISAVQLLKGMMVYGGASNK